MGWQGPQGPQADPTLAAFGARARLGWAASAPDASSASPGSSPGQSIGPESAVAQLPTSLRVWPWAVMEPPSVKQGQGHPPRGSQDAGVAH